MAFHRKQAVIGASVALFAILGCVIYAIARQGDGTRELAQAPLNIANQIRPAFIMGVDDSGSMVFEVNFDQDEQAYWNDLNGTTRNGFFVNANAPATSGVLRTSGRGSYYHLIQNGIRLDQAGNTLNTNTNAMRLGIPPLDLFGFARSPDINRQYFNPAIQYLPWQNADGTYWPNVSYTAAPSDPRVAGSAGTRGPNPIVTYDFSAVEGRTTNYFAFRFQPGMRLPAGTQYYMRDDRHSAGCGGLGTTNATRNTWVTLSSAHLITDTNNLVYATNNTNRGGGCEIHIRYFPAVVYLLPGTPAPVGFDLSKRTVAANAGGPGIDLYKYELRQENFTSNYAEAIQNFANWYTYHGNRNRAMVASMTQSMVSVNNMRVGYFSINRRSGTNPGMASGNVLMRQLPDERSTLFSSFYTLAADGGTPNRSAVVYMGDQFRRTDSSAPVQLTCQKNAGMLFTDGYTNEGGTLGNVYRNFGDTDGSLPRPLGGNSNGNTIADIAYWFYANNLRADLAEGMVPVPQECKLANGSIDPNASLRLDCQTNLHMNFYGITLGTPGAIYGVNQAATDDPYTNHPNWTATGTMNLNPANVDDIWHASLNTRGEYINATTPNDVTAAMRRVLQAVGEGTTPSGSIALTGSRIGTGSLTVVPFYEATNNSTDWYSRLTAQEVTANPTTGLVSFTNKWEASSKMPVHGSRNILSAVTAASGVTPSVVPFNATNVTLDNLCSNNKARCTAASITALGVSLGEAMDYLRGDRSLEAAGTLRTRTTVLGDIVNSAPVVTSPVDDYGYRSLRGTSADSYDTYNYAGYLETKKSRAPMVYAGANDGMLHAFNGNTGVEEFAYIPATARGHMGNLLFPYKAEDRNDQVFQHRYYVDGPVTVSDAHYGGSWKTVLIGTAGAGGRSVFGFNVSNATNFAAGNVLWELSDQVANTTIRDNIGHVLGKPLVVPVKVGNTVSWKAIFGNGYGSINGRAALFVVDVATGAATVIQASENDAALPASNGLGNIVILDRYAGSTDTKGTDGYADTVYGADQNGAVWKFDLRSGTTTTLTTPFFIAQDAAGNRQAITGGFAAARSPGVGVMLYFGTGSFSFEEDGTDRAMQTLYGIIDKEDGTTIASRDDLHQQRVLADAEGIRSVSTTLSMPGKRGWYLELGVSGATGNPVATGERFVGNPVVESGVVFFPTYEPTATTGCSTEGANRLYGLSAFNGGAALTHVRIGSPTGTSPGAGTGAVGLNTGGTAPVKDVAVMSTPRVSPLGATPTPEEEAAALGAQCSMVIQAAGAPPMYMPRPCGRQSWRQVR